VKKKPVTKTGKGGSDENVLATSPGGRSSRNCPTNKGIKGLGKKKKKKPQGKVEVDNLGRTPSREDQKKKKKQ